MGLHYLFGIPKEGVGVKIFGGVEPQVELLLPVAFPLSEHIGVDYIWISTKVSKKFEVYLVPYRSLRFKLHQNQSHDMISCRNCNRDMRQSNHTCRKSNFKSWFSWAAKGPFGNWASINS